MFTTSGISFAGKSVLLSVILPGMLLVTRVEAASSTPKNTTKTAVAKHAIQTKQTTKRQDKKRRKSGEKKSLAGTNLSLFSPARQRHPLTKQSLKSLSLGSFTLRAYTWPARSKKPLSRTATGTIPSSERTVAVDPRVIPFGTKIYIEGVGERVAEDSGAKIKGRQLDVFLPTVEHCKNFGVQTRDVKIMLD